MTISTVSTLARAATLLLLGLALNAAACRELQQEDQATETPPPAEVSSPTPAAASSTMTIYGAAWVDARPAASGVAIRALLGSVECARDVVSRFPDDPTNFFSIRVPNTTSQAGCGVDGAEVRIEVDGQLSNQTFTWSNSTVGPTDLVVGPQFARLTGVLTLNDPVPGEWIEVEPIIDGAVCGVQLNAGQGTATEFYYYVVVDPEELRPGCGRTGSQIELQPILVSNAGATRIPLAKVLPSANWQPDVSLDLPTVALTR